MFRKSSSVNGGSEATRRRSRSHLARRNEVIARDGRIVLAIRCRSIICSPIKYWERGRPARISGFPTLLARKGNAGGTPALPAIASPPPKGEGKRNRSLESLHRQTILTSVAPHE